MDRNVGTKGDVRVVAQDDGWAVEVRGERASWHRNRFSADLAAGSLSRAREGRALASPQRPRRGSHPE